MAIYGAEPLGSRPRTLHHPAPPDTRRLPGSTGPRANPLRRCGSVGGVGLQIVRDRVVQRTKSAYIFGAICPEHGKGAGLILPFCNTETMSLHMAEISLAVAPGAHADVLMAQAGWHKIAMEPGRGSVWKYV